MITKFCVWTGASATDILGKSRKDYICDARHVYWFRLNERLSLSQIARLCYVNHSTVLHGINRVKEQRNTDKNIKYLLQQTENIWIMTKKQAAPTLDIERVKEVHYNNLFKKLVVILNDGDTVVKHDEEAVKLFKELSNG